MSNWARQAKLAWSQKDFIRAGDFYKLDGNFRLAIKAYEKGKQPVKAARIYEDLGKIKKAEKIFLKEGSAVDVAQFFIRNERVDDAVETYLRNGLEFEAAELFEKMQRLEEAAEIYNKLRFYEKAGILFGKSKQLDKAISALGLALKQVQESDAPSAKSKVARYQDWIANFYLALGQFHKAGELFELLMQREKAARCFAKAGDDVRGAQILLKIGKSDEAERILRDSTSPEANAILGELLLSHGKFAEALTFLQKSDNQELKAECLEKLGHLGQAAKIFEELGNYRKAGSLYAESGDFRKAALIFEEKGFFAEAADAYEKVDEFVFAARLYKLAKRNFQAGSCLFKANKLEEALECLQQVEEMSDEGPQAKYLMAQIFFKQEFYSVASKLFDELITSGQSFGGELIDCLYQLARSYEVLGELEEARVYYERVCAKKATYLDVRKRLEYVTRKLGKTKSQTNTETTLLMPNQLRPGEIIADRFKILSEIGKGGMGYIFKVRDLSLDRDVALKMLIHNRGSFEELKMELINARDLTHPYIIKVFDIGEWKNVCYFTMELVEGPALKKYIEREPIDPIQPKIEILIKICEALQAAHDMEIIHRDIKPQNILLDEQMNPKLLDFGIARRKDQVNPNQGISGSPKYMAPEQIQNTGADPRTDIYAIGIIMFYMFTKKEPFVGKDANEILLMQINRALPDPSEYNPQIPFWLSEIIQKCCAKNKDLRFQTMAELIEELKLNQLDYHE